MFAKLPALAIVVMAPFLLGATSAPTQSINIDNFAFTPASLTIAPGTTVVWTNRDDIPHTVTSADTPRLFKSPPLDTGDTISHTFDHAGRFVYFCALHAHMRGVIVVQ